MIDTKIATHLEKYFSLSRTQFIEEDYALSAFLVIMAIEEAAKLIALGDSSPTEKKQGKQLKEFLNHDDKYSIAVINLLEQSAQYNTLPEKWQDEVWSWWDRSKRTTKLMRIRP